jgi:MFS family permease
LTQNDPSGTAVEPAGKSVRLLLANADFRRVWLIGIFSGVVRWLELLAYGIYAFDLTGSAFLVTTFTLLRFIPFALFGAVTGVLVDRFGHQNVLRYSLLLMCLTSAALVWLSATDQLELWHLAIANILGGFYWTTDFPARRNLIGQLAGPNLLARALSFDAACNTLTRAAGPLCGGVLMATLGISGIINLSAVLYVMAALLAFRMMVDSQRPESVALSLAREIWGGVRFAATRRDLLAAFSITLIFNLFGFPFTALIPVIGKQVLGLSPDGVGMIAAAEGMGAVIGALAAGRGRTTGQIWTNYAGGVVACLAGAFIIGAGSHILTVVPGVLLAGLGGGFFAASQVTIIYHLSPPDQRSRMLGLLSFCIGAAPIGFAWLGFMADWLGTGLSLMLMAGEGGLAMLLFWFVFRHNVRASTT